MSYWVITIPSFPQIKCCRSFCDSNHPFVSWVCRIETITHNYKLTILLFMSLIVISDNDKPFKISQFSPWLINTINIVKVQQNLFSSGFQIFHDSYLRTIEKEEKILQHHLVKSFSIIQSSMTSSSWSLKQGPKQMLVVWRFGCMFMFMMCRAY